MESQVLEQKPGSRETLGTEEVFAKYVASRPWLKFYDEGVPPDI